MAAYVARRLEEKAANATINRELAALKRGFRLGERPGRVRGRPYIALLEEHNTRKGFFEEEQFQAVLAHLPDHLKAVFETAYITGWRVKSEILTRQKAHVDLKAGWLRLEPGETKNGEGRQFPLVPRLRAVLEAQLERTRQLEQATDQIIPWLFHRGGPRYQVLPSGVAHSVPQGRLRPGAHFGHRDHSDRSIVITKIG